MLTFPKNEIPYEMRHLQICIDSYRRGEPAGRIYSGISQNACRFESVMPLLHLIEDLLDRETSLERFEENRSLHTASMAPLAGVWQSAERRPGRLVTFALQIHFRQNATWQGEIIWLEKQRAAYFRSALEMLFIMDGVLAELEGLAEKGS